jgi:hypothetical protein
VENRIRIKLEQPCGYAALTPRLPGSPRQPGIRADLLNCGNTAHGSDRIAAKGAAAPISAGSRVEIKHGAHEVAKIDRGQ